ncbi:hypothetical protein GCM10012279_22790 [Micromonospora yangpuensis]|nr:hypothetical protein GCM10012279_22790 [Micromonospora yangpuensis]
MVAAADEPGQVRIKLAANVWTADDGQQTGTPPFIPDCQVTRFRKERPMLVGVATTSRKERRALVWSGGDTHPDPDPGNPTGTRHHHIPDPATRPPPQPRSSAPTSAEGHHIHDPVP